MPEEKQFHFPFIPPILSRWVKTTLTCYISLVILYQERFGYVISMPSVHKRTFNVLRMILIDVLTDQENFLYVDLDNSILCLYCV